MVYKIASEAAIRQYINKEIVACDDGCASILARPLTPEYPEQERDSDLQYTLNLKQSGVNSLALLETALREGKAFDIVFRYEEFESFVSFVVREDGLIRCFETSGRRDIPETDSGSYEIERISSAYACTKVTEKHRKKAKDANDLYSELYYDFIYQQKLAKFLALYGASLTGTGAADAVIDGEVIEHFNAERKGDRIVYTVTRAYKKAVGL